MSMTDNVNSSLLEVNVDASKHVNKVVTVPKKRLMHSGNFFVDFILVFWRL